MNFHPLSRHHRRGMTLVEVMVSLVILVITFTALSSALVYQYRMGRTHKMRVFATEAANSTVEELKGILFTQCGVNPANPNDPISNPTTVLMNDEAVDAIAQPFTITRRFRGYGAVASATASGLTSTNGGGQSNWRAGQFVGHPVMIVTGPGQGQVRIITANTANSLTVDQPWIAVPTNASTFQIDGGKNVEVEVTWNANDRPQSYTIEALIISR